MDAHEQRFHISLKLLVAIVTSEPTTSLEDAERQLDRVQSFFPRIDSKVSAIFAITAAQLAIAALNLSREDLVHWYVWVLMALFIGGVGWTMISLYFCTYPHLGGGDASLTYFKKIAEMSEEEFDGRYKALTHSELQDDFIRQVWRNAQIVNIKYWYLRNATISSMLSLAPWTLLLLAVTLAQGDVPLVQ